MVNEQLFLAVDYILAQRYDDARQLLRTIDHPKAREWLVRLDSYTKQPAGKTAEMARSSAPQAAPAVNIYTTPAPSYSLPMPVASLVLPASQTPNILSFPLGLAGGLIGAAIGAAIWIIVTVITGYETTLAAILIGALAGSGAVFLSGGKRGWLIQLAGLLSAAGGIVAAEYFSLYALLLGDPVELLNSGVDLETILRTVPPFSNQNVTQITAALQETASPLDLVFLLIAALAAWRIAARRG